MLEMHPELSGIILCRKMLSLWERKPLAGRIWRAAKPFV